MELSVEVKKVLDRAFHFARGPEYICVETDRLLNMFTYHRLIMTQRDTLIAHGMDASDADQFFDMIMNPPDRDVMIAYGMERFESLATAGAAT